MGTSGRYNRNQDLWRKADRERLEQSLTIWEIITCGFVICAAVLFMLETLDMETSFYVFLTTEPLSPKSLSLSPLLVCGIYSLILSDLLINALGKGLAAAGVKDLLLWGPRDRWRTAYAERQWKQFFILCVYCIKFLVNILEKTKANNKHRLARKTREPGNGEEAHQQMSALDEIMQSSADLKLTNMTKTSEKTSKTISNISTEKTISLKSKSTHKHEHKEKERTRKTASEPSLFLKDRSKVAYEPKVISKLTVKFDNKH